MTFGALGYASGPTPHGRVTPRGPGAGRCAPLFGRRHRLRSWARPGRRCQHARALAHCHWRFSRPRRHRAAGPCRSLRRGGPRPGEGASWGPSQRSARRGPPARCAARARQRLVTLALTQALGPAGTPPSPATQSPGWTRAARGPGPGPAAAGWCGRSGATLGQAAKSATCAPTLAKFWAHPFSHDEGDEALKHLDYHPRQAFSAV